MNTPPTPKRFNREEWSEKFFANLPKKSGNFVLALNNPDHAIAFAAFVSCFNDLETWIEKLATDILGADRDVSIHVLRSILTSKGKISLLESVLERAERNHDKPVQYEIAIREFERISRERNNYVHARYATDSDTGEVYWVKPNGDPMLLDVAAWEKLDLKKLNKETNAISDLVISIVDILSASAKRREEQPPQSDGNK